MIVKDCSSLVLCVILITILKRLIISLKYLKSIVMLSHIFCYSGSSESDSDGEEEVTAKAFLKKKPEALPDASKFLKSAKGSGVRECCRTKIHFGQH